MAQHIHLVFVCPVMGSLEVHLGMGMYPELPLENSSLVGR